MPENPAKSLTFGFKETIMTLVSDRGMGKAVRYRSTVLEGVLKYENVESCCGTLQRHQPDRANPDRSGRWRSAGSAGTRRRLGRRTRHPVRRCLEGHRTGSGLRHRGECAGTRLVQTRPPVWYGHLAVYADDLSGRGHCIHRKLHLSADGRPGRGRSVGCGAAGLG